MSDDIVPTPPRKKDGGSRLDVANTLRKLNLKHSFRTLTLPKKEKKSPVVREEEKKSKGAQRPDAPATVSDTLPITTTTTTTTTSTETITKSSVENEHESKNDDHELEAEQQTTVADKNAPSRFLGEGVSFKAKLIGILEVSEARGDRMCQDALADLKMAIRAAGEHKQRISINITIDGLRLRDEKTADCLYHHPVHKISFIAQDMNDSRAFGYIFGSPDTGHRFFGIKTDKAASQVVIAMRDLFQVVFELKKQEIELAKQHMDHPSGYLEGSTTNKNGVSEANQLRSLTDASSSGSVKENGSSIPSGGGLNQSSGGGATAIAGKSSGAGGDIVDLLDLEFELNNIQQGINQMDRITPSDPFETSAISSSDPFGDSFLPKTTNQTRNNVGMIPPPPSSTIRKRGTNIELNNPTISTPNSLVQQSSVQASSSNANEKHWFDQETESLFEEGELAMPPLNTSTTSTSAVSAVSSLQTNIPPLIDQIVQDASLSNTFDVFTELDPLGTGRSKPYIDRKDFFQDLKNPPKKVLKDMTTSDATVISTIVPSSSSNAITPNASIASTSPTPPTFTATFPMAPLAQPDPFTDTDPFEDGFSMPSMSSNPDPFDTGFADFNAFHSPLRVSLPPEHSQATTPLETTQQIPPTAKPRTKTKISKQITLNAPRLPSPQPSRRFNKQITLDEGLTLCNRAAGTPSPPPLQMLHGLGESETHSRLSESSTEIADIAPEPPPRPLAAIKPPPLPPKRHNTAIGRPPPRPPHAGDDHYDYIENYETSSSPPSGTVKSPPLPVPARRPRGRQPLVGASPGDDGYLVPFPLLPPPQKKTPTRTDSETSENSKTKPSLDITLSQLTSSGLDELAIALGISASELSTMTVVELTAALARAESNQTNQGRYDPLRESIDEEQPMFKADFETTPAPNDDQVFQEAPFDKYAVFRELIPDSRKVEEEREDNESIKEEIPTESEVIQEEIESNLPSLCDKPFESEGTFEANFEQTPDSPPAPIFETNFETSFETKSEISEPLTPPSMISTSNLDTERRPKTPRTPETKLETIAETAAESAAAAAEEDRYAALREIATEEPEVIGEDKETSSEKEESVKEEYDLLSLSRQHSESTDTPPPEGPAAPSTPGQSQPAQISAPPLVQQNEEASPASHTPPSSLIAKSPCLPCARAHCKDIDDWARFDLTPAPVQQTGGSEGGVSPWSSDGKEFRPQWPGEERPSRRRQQQPSRRPPATWDGDESEEPQWSDGEGGYYEERQYRRRPWRPPRRDISPWDEEEDDYDWGRPRGRRRGWTDERRSSRESISWDEEDRYDYRRQPDHSYSRRRVPDRYYRDSRDRSWDEEYCEPEEEEENRFSRRWRPSSAGETRRKYKQRPRSRDGPVSSDEYWRRPPRPRKGLQSSQQQPPPPPPSHRSPFEDDFAFSFDGSSIDALSPEDAHESRSRRRTHETDSLRRRGKSHDSVASSMALSPEDAPRSPRGARPRGQQSSRTSPFEDNFTPTSPGGRESSHRFEDEPRKPPPSSSSPTTSFTATSATTTIPISSGRGLRGHLLRADSSSSLRKSESVNIFARENDPFDDDFFANGSGGSPHPTSTTLPRPHHSSNNNGGAEQKWSRAFDAFNFNDDDDK